ncbi:MAG: hypothetical protein AB7I30_19345, partial [Isosphaeraceae bacterium]
HAIQGGQFALARLKIQGPGLDDTAGGGGAVGTQDPPVDPPDDLPVTPPVGPTGTSPTGIVMPPGFGGPPGGITYPDMGYRPVPVSPVPIGKPVFVPRPPGAPLPPANPPGSNPVNLTPPPAAPPKGPTATGTGGGRPIVGRPLPRPTPIRGGGGGGGVTRPTRAPSGQVLPGPIPTIGGVKADRIRGTVSIGFTQPMSPTSVGSIGAYQLIGAGADGVFGTADDVVFTITGARYDGPSRTVALTVAGGLPAGMALRLTVDGLALASGLGVALDGDGDGHRGGLYVGVIA